MIKLLYCSQIYIMKNQKFLFLLLLLSPNLFAQTDSITFVDAKWNTQKIAKGIILKQYSFVDNVFQSNQTISVLEIQQSKKTKFAFGFEEKFLKNTSDFGQQVKAIAAINGNFFDIKNGGSVDFLKVNNIVINQNQLQKSKRAFHQKAAIVILNGKMEIRKWNETDDWENNLQYSDVMVSGPLLLFENKLQVLDSLAFNKNRHPRSVIAQTKKGKILLITIDGRDKNAQGMSLFEVQKMLQWLDTENGINFDGGGSTTLWVKNQPENGIVNFPCDNKVWDKAGERKVANVLLVFRNQ